MKNQWGGRFRCEWHDQHPSMKHAMRRYDDGVRWKYVIMSFIISSLFHGHVITQHITRAFHSDSSTPYQCTSSTIEIWNHVKGLCSTITCICDMKLAKTG